MIPFIFKGQWPVSRAESEIYQCSRLLDKNHSAFYFYLLTNKRSNSRVCECAGGHATCLETSEMLFEGKITL